MESRKLNIVLHCGKGLEDVKYFGTMDPYAEVWIAGDSKNSKPIKTPHAEKGACNPIWEYSMVFDNVSMNKEYILFFKIKHHGKMFDRNIGEVQVPFADLLAADAPRDKVRYQVTLTSGEKKGEIIVSHKFSELVVTSGDKGTSKVARPRGKKKKEHVTKGIGKKVTEKMATMVAEVAVIAGLTAVVGILEKQDEGGPSAQEAQNEPQNMENEDVDVDEDEDEDLDEDEDEDEDEY